MGDDTDDKLFDLLDEWALLHKQGKDVSVHKLCQDYPELVEELQRRIKTLKATDWLDEPLGDRDEPPLVRSKPGDCGLPNHLGRYRLDELVGAGGFGQVWRGFDSELHRAVAIKIPRPDRVSTPERIERFIEEARRVAQLKHPGIVPVHDVGREDGFCFIVSDFIEGQNLAEVISNNRPSQADACRIVAEVARILNYAHDLGYIHRDVKPANILVDDQKKVFLTDFGIAATVEELSHATSSTGTLPYMSPEQLAGEPVDGRTDIYSLGVVLVELLLGEKAATADDLAKTISRIKDGNAIHRLKSASLPAGLKAICRKCLAPNRDDRFETAGAVANALNKLSEKQSRSGTWITGFSVLLLVGLMAAFWLPRFWLPTETDEQPAQVARVTASTDASGLIVAEPGHVFETNSPVSSLAMDSKAGRLLVGCVDGTAMLLSLKDEETQPVKLDNASAVTAIVVSPSGSRAVCGCANGLVRIWDLAQSPPEELVTLLGHSGRINTLAFNSDGSALAAGSDDQTAQVWDLSVTPPQLAKLPTAEGSVLALTFLGNELAIGIGSGSDQPAHLWIWQVALAEQQLHPIDIKSLDQITGIEAFSFSPDGQFMAVVGRDGKIAALELEVHPEHRRRAIRMVGHLERPSERISAIQFLPSSEPVIAIGCGSNIVFWDVRTNQQLARIEESSPLQCLAISQDGRTVATGTQSQVRTWNLPRDYGRSQ